MSARVLSMIATTSARSAAGTANLSSVCATSSINASHSRGAMRRCRCDLSMSLPVYLILTDACSVVGRIVVLALQPERIVDEVEQAIETDGRPPDGGEIEVSHSHI